MLRKVPQRTCLGCGIVQPKRNMIRVIRTPGGSVEVDPTGKRSGRGAYVCPNEKCLDMVKKGKRIEKALGVTPPSSIFEMLQARIEEINCQ
jgi:predicted RNA-binding protein YlxR (DUF448 family)